MLQALLNELNQPSDKVNLLQVADIICRDESLAAQCLRMANSPLYSRGPAMDSVRGAVRTLGTARIRDIAVSCGLLRLAPTPGKGLDPVVFWQHSMACAIVARKLARAVGYGDPEKAYLAGLLHDIGYILNLVVFPAQTKVALEKAAREGRFMGDVEHSDLGFTHCQSGELLGRQWNLSEELVEVILCHHNGAAAVCNPALVAIVALADRLSRASNLGMGYTETPSPLDFYEADWAILLQHCPLAQEMSWSAFVKDSDSYIEEIRNLVAAMCKSN